MADLRVDNEADELAVAMVQALAHQDGARALQIGENLEPLIDGRPALRSRHAAWTAQAHLLNGQHDAARTAVTEALILATEAGEDDALPSLRELQANVIRAKAATAAAQAAPLPDTPLGRALSAIDAGDLTSGTALAQDARASAHATGDHREEVFALLALARVPTETEAAIHAAHAVADASHDKNLVTAVARAARAAGVSLPTHVF